MNASNSQPEPLELNLERSVRPGGPLPLKASAVCAPHGLRFDPSQAPGCVLCQRSSAPPQQLSLRVPLTIVVVGVFLLVVATWLASR